MTNNLFPNLEEVLSRFGEKIVNHYRETLKQEGAIATGKLYDSVSYEVSSNSGSFILSVSLLDYARYVENGRRPGKFPPPNVIRDWIRVKNIAPRPVNGKLPTQEQLAYLIGRHISKFGIAPSHYLVDSMGEAWMELETEIDKAVMKDLEDNIDELLKVVWN